MTTTTATPVPHDPRPATAGDLEGVAATLAAAFLDDPVMAWCYPQPRRRGAILPALFRRLAEAYLPHGGIQTAPGHEAAAIWIPMPAEVDDGSLATDLERISGEDAGRLFALLEILEAHHPGHAAHRYLMAIGTRPASQGTGIGSRMLAAVLDACDADGTPAYLEATTPRNRRLYERHGFAVTDLLTLPGGPEIACMWRPPRAGS